ncbi:MAG: RNA polymerase factor sigma-54 [Pseudomonadota bacterium]
MALTQRLDLRQSQSLVMTPQLQQAIKLLQLSNLELADYVERELEQNPLLDREDLDGLAERRSNGRDDNGAEAENGAASDLTSDRIGADRLATSDTLASDNDAPLDADMSSVFNHDSSAEDVSAGAVGADVPIGMGMNGSSAAGRGGSQAGDDDDFGFDRTLSEPKTLREYLEEQINIAFSDATDRLIMAVLVDHLDESGYFRGETAEIADQLGCDPARVSDALGQAKRFDPPGIFARDLRDCLALQLAEANRLDPAMQTLLDNLDLLAQRDFTALMRLCAVDMEDISDMVGEIRALNPKPALLFTEEVAQSVTPDVLMRAQRGGGWLIELNSDTLPRVLVNQQYYTSVTSRIRNKTEREFMSECFASANWLVKSLHQRATTILKVATEIVRQQDGFFAHGVQNLKPLILRDIADAIGMHESTVSRVTSNKFIETPRGTFELKYFFTPAIPGASGASAHSAEAVRHRIKVLIDGETPSETLSDDRIVEVLREDGIDIARRTVAKYREALRIPSSVQRRREKTIKL